MKVIASTGKEDVAVVYIGDLGNSRLVEFVEAINPPTPRDEKWVILVSTLYGCPVGCAMCDAGGYYHGKVSMEDMFAQIDFLVRRHYPSGDIPARQFKIQFARMGEPSFNMDVLGVLEELPERYHAPGFMPSISTIAPAGVDQFFERLLEIKQEKYCAGNFQFQFSIHTTDEEQRERMIPVKKWDFARMAAYGKRLYAPGDRKITLNFALVQGMPVDPAVLLRYFNPTRFLVKITPLNPTYRAQEHGLASHIDPGSNGESSEIVTALREAGYQVIVSIGTLEENYIGSNCGQYLRTHLEAAQPLREGYTYRLQEYS